MKTRVGCVVMGTRLYDIHVVSNTYSGPADVQDGDWPVVADRGQGGEVRDWVASQRLPAGPAVWAAGGRGEWPADADAGQFALGPGDLLRGIAEQGEGDRRGPGTYTP